MVKWMELLVSSFCVVFSSIYIWNTLNDKKIKITSIKCLIVAIICSAFVAVNYVYSPNFIKPLISTLLLLLSFSVLYKEGVKKTIIIIIFSQVISIVAELIYVSSVALIKHVGASVIVEQCSGSVITNIFVSIISIAVVNIPFVKRVYNNIIQITDKIKKYQIIVFSIILIVIANVLTTYLYYKVNLVFLILINTSIITIYMIFIYFYLKTNNNYAKVYDKYNMTLNSLKEYEDILSRYRVSNHENKNQLLTIRGMIKNKKVTSYIDEIIENKLKDNEKLMFESLVIPEGGLRGLIYSKMLLMKENNIDYDLCIDNALKTTDLSKISDELMLNICNIVGVYLDNAIEAVKDLDEKYIVIEMYLDKTLNIAITNNYNENINIDSMDNIGYSTKGGNHGYGLSLVKEIIDKNKNIENVRRISDDEFTQEIKIKM